MYKEKKTHGSIGFPFEIYHNICNHGLCLFTHYHREFEIIYIHSGDGFAYIDNESYRVSNGDILFVNSEQLHGIVSASEEDGMFTSIVFAPEFLGKADEITVQFITPILNRSLQIPTLVRNNDELIAYMLQLSAQDNEKYFYLKAKSLIFKIWEILISQSVSVFSSANDTRLKDIKTVIDYIEKHYSQKIALDQLAKLANMSKVYFCRKFTEIVGISPIRYLMQIRIEHSCSLLENVNIGIGNIAMECGFSSFSYYSEVFKKIIGCTPQSYRRKLANSQPVHK